MPGQLLPADDRGLQYGDGLFETMLVRAARARFLDAHLARLARVARASAFRSRLDATARGDRRSGRDGAAARDPQDHRDARQRAAARLRPAGDEMPRRVVSLVARAAARMRRSTRASLCAWRDSRLGENPALAGIKHLNRLENVLAAARIRGSGVLRVTAARCRGNLVSAAP